MNSACNFIQYLYLQAVQVNCQQMCNVSEKIWHFSMVSWGITFFHFYEFATLEMNLSERTE